MNLQPTHKDFASKFSTYVLPGRVTDPKRGIIETLDAERIGFGTAYLSERFGTKDTSVLCAAMGQATKNIGVGGTTYFSNRHPLTLASLMSSMQSLFDGRFSLIFARGHEGLFKEWGMPWTSFALMKDTVQILRTLLKGETVRYKGPAGDYPEMNMVDRYMGPPPPMILTAIGPKTLEFAGANFDGVLLHPMMTVETVGRMAAIAREGAKKAGRDPASVRVIANVIAAPDLAKAEEDAVVGGRAITYMHGYGEVLVKANGWDPIWLEKLRAHPTFANLGSTMADQAFTRQQLVESSYVLPREWYTSSNAMGSAAQCASKLKDYLDAGADEILLHGSAPGQMGKMAEELKKLYPN